MANNGSLPPAQQPHSLAQPRSGSNVAVIAATRSAGYADAAMSWVRRTPPTTIAGVAAAAAFFVLAAMGYSPLAWLLWPFRLLLAGLWSCRYLFALVVATVGGAIYLFAEPTLLAKLNEALYTVDEHGKPNGPPAHQHPPTAAACDGLTSRTAFATTA